MRTTTCTYSETELRSFDNATLLAKKGLYKASTTVALWLTRAKQRRQLKKRIGDRDFLKDIGVSSIDVRIEANKPFWK